MLPLELERIIEIENKLSLLEKQVKNHDELLHILIRQSTEDTKLLKRILALLPQEKY